VEFVEAAPTKSLKSKNAPGKSRAAKSKSKKQIKSRSKNKCGKCDEEAEQAELSIGGAGGDGDHQVIEIDLDDPEHGWKIGTIPPGLFPPGLGEQNEEVGEGEEGGSCMECFDP
jgi:hypothetical protein